MPKSLRKTVVGKKTLGRHTDEAWLRGRQKGYDAGAENERILVVNYLRAIAKAWENVGDRSKGEPMLAVAADIERELHLRVSNGDPKS